jgi:putative NADH-flavin reductase
MKIVVFGASGGTGRAVIVRALADGHQVTAFVRDEASLAPADALTIMKGDAMVASDVAMAAEGQDAIVMALGNPQTWLARMFGARRVADRTICETGTRHVINALPQDTQTRIVVVSAFGVGATRQALPLSYKIFYQLLLKEQIADKEKQEAALRATRLPYVLIQPAVLTDGPETGAWTANPDARLGRAEVSRADLAACILQTLKDGAPVGQTLTFSGS